MAEPRNARLTDAQIIGNETRLLTFQIEEVRPLGFVGGQYVIVNTGIPLPGGKIAKRAYSLLSPDTDQHRFQIAVKRVGTGPGSNFMHTLSVGAELTFSGPWGKFYPSDGEADQPTLIFATDTGITAALGLLRGGQFSLSNTRLVWFLDKPDYFIPESMVRGLLVFEDRNAHSTGGSPVCAGEPPVLRGEGHQLQTALPPGFDLTILTTGLPVHHPERVATALALMRKICVDSRPQRAFLSGDGAILFPLCEELKALGVPEPGIRMECFFNNLFRKAP